MQICPIEEHHWRSIVEIQSEAYVDIEPESEAVLRRKWLLSPQSCAVALGEDGDVLGYCLSHPWHGEGAPSLYEEIEGVPESNNLFLHDIAVASRGQNRGVASALCNEMIGFARSRGFVSLTLIAIQGAHALWSRFGFEGVLGFEPPTSYGKGAVFMKLEVDS